MSFQAGFDDFTEAALAIRMLAGTLIELVNGEVVAAAYTVCSCGGGFDRDCRCLHHSGTTDVCYRGFRILD